MRTAVDAASITARIARRIRACRERLQMTQADLAAAIGVSRASVTNVEAGRQEMPVSKLVAAAAALGVTIGGLCGEEELPELPSVWLETTLVVMCEDCGNVAEVTDPAEAAKTRQLHIAQHLAIGGQQ